ncbi:MAG: cupin domain-containing protein [Cellvibrionales bacterium]|nr:cupin domain-containing protein [Cellvibrionales bacterium]
MKGFLLFACLPLLAVAAPKPLLQTTTSWDGGVISYPKGEIEITSIELNVPEGKTSSYHCHPIPTLGYILLGTVEVETIDGKKVTLTQGQSAVEVMKTPHRAKSLGGPAKIIVFYAGATHIPTTIKLGEEKAGFSCHKNPA